MILSLMIIALSYFLRLVSPRLIWLPLADWLHLVMNELDRLAQQLHVIIYGEK